MKNLTLGIHHITAIASKPQENFDFYTRTLGLRLVKKSVNQDQVEAYHFFFGDKIGDPGMDLTFFTFDPIIQGHRGAGVVSTISLAVNVEAFEFWQRRLNEKKVKQEKLHTQFDHQRVVFYDNDNQRLELVAVEKEIFSSGVAEVWTTPEINTHNAIGYFHSARLSVTNKQSLELILTNILGFRPIDQDAQVTLYNLSSTNRAAYLEIEEHPDQDFANSGSGTVHHIAFQVKDEAHLIELREKVLGLGLYPTEVINRFYFKSVYFRTPSGILFELATNGPGFTVDESEKELGKTLKLPPWLEPERVVIEGNLEKIKD